VTDALQNEKAIEIEERMYLHRFLQHSRFSVCGGDSAIDGSFWF